MPLLAVIEELGAASPFGVYMYDISTRLVTTSVLLTRNDFLFLQCMALLAATNESDAASLPIFTSDTGVHE